MKKRWIITEAGQGGIVSLKLFLGTNDEARKCLAQKLNHAKEFWWGQVGNAKASPIAEDIDGDLHASLIFRDGRSWYVYNFMATAEDTMPMETYMSSE